MTRDELKSKLDAHEKWVRGEAGGVRAHLSGANLRGAYLSGANLSGAYLSGAHLSGANLRRADLSGANLSGANLRGANLSGANLSGAYLSGANLRDANLRGANLIGADLRDANLIAIREDLRLVLDAAQAEVPALLTALQEGRVDGSVYRGECACLIGTIANVRNVNHDELDGELAPDSDRPAERWFLAIRKGDTPATSQVSAITVAWVEEWLAEQAKTVQS